MNQNMNQNMNQIMTKSINLEDIIKSYSQSKALNLFEQGKTQQAFWDNDHISKMMLMAHLNPNWDAASRKPPTIDATCQWIYKTLNLEPGNALLDLGCGPGLYAWRFYKMGLGVTGIDYSKRSIQYANQYAKNHQLNITYIYSDYLDLDREEEFDVVVLIYCDFGVLSPTDRIKLLKKVHRSLKPKGYFVFDVWSTQYKELTQPKKNWTIHTDQGFWKPYAHIELTEQTYYEDQAVALRQHFILQQDSPHELEVFNLWEQCYTVESITSLLEGQNYKVCSVHSDLMGTPYCNESNTLGLVAQKV